MSIAAIAVALTAGAVPLALAANPASGPSADGRQQLNVSIDSPTNGATVPEGALTVTGQASISRVAADTSVAYVVDNSGSTLSGAGSGGPGDCNGDGVVDAGDDINNDGSPGTILDCEIRGVLALNDSIRPSGAVPVAIVGFGSSGVIADAGPAADQQDFTTADADANGNGTNDVQEVMTSLTGSGFSVFSPRSSGGGTNFDDALATMNEAFAPVTGNKLGFFLSDGQSSLSTGPGSPLQATKDAGTVVDTFSVGQGAAGCDPGSGLRTIADETGGTCTEVPDPTQLAAAFGGAAQIDRVEVRVGDGSPVVANLEGSGNWTANVQIPAGTSVIRATLHATDGSSVTADVTVNTAPSGGCPFAVNGRVVNGDDTAETILGTPNNDLLNGGGGDDSIDGIPGDDCINGQAGNDAMLGADGSDQIRGEAGSDDASGNVGNDDIDGGTDPDELFGNEDNDRVIGRGSDDRIKGGPDKDRVQGSGGKDRVNGDGGKDTVRGGTKNDRVFGGPGNDKVQSQGGKDRVSGGDGKDSIRAGGGNDEVDAADGFRDKVKCGLGFDEAVVDDKDVVNDDCNEVTVKQGNR